MQNNSNGRRSSTNPVRVSLIDKEDKNLTRNDLRKTITIKSKISVSANDVSHIPRPHKRSSSCDPASNRRSNLKGKSLLHQPVTPKTLHQAPVTPVTNIRKLIAKGLPTGSRSQSDDRASTIGAKGARKDTRHLTDKNYQAHMLNKIDSYIHEIQCSSMLNSNGSLKPITLKIFVEVSGLLVKLIDPKQVLTLNNYVEELPKIAKKLNYPGVITKSLLKTANTIHSWPYVLGWLCWLVQVCQAKDLAYNHFQWDNIPFVGTGQQMQDSRNTFLFQLDMYKAWNDEKPDEEAALVDKYLKEVERQQGVSEYELAEARVALDAEEKNLQEIEQQSKDIDAEVTSLEEMLISLQEDIAKKNNDIKVKEDYVKNFKTETDEIETKCKSLKEQIELKNKQHTELLSIIKEQPMSKVEKDKIVNRCMELQNYMHQFDDHLKDMQKDIYTLDIKIASVNNNLNKIVLAYNKEIFMLFGSDKNIDVEELKMPEKDFLNPHIMDILTEKANLMNELKDGLKEKLTKLESNIQDNTNELELLQEKMRVLEENNATAFNKLQEKKVQVNNAKHEESKLREEVQIIQNDIRKCQESAPDLKTIICELKEAKEKLDAVQRRKMFIEQNGKLFFDKLDEMIGEHRNNLSRILEKGERKLM